MDQGDTRRPRERFEEHSMRDEIQLPTSSSPSQSHQTSAGNWDLPVSPTRRVSAMGEYRDPDNVGIRRRSSAISRRSGSEVPSLPRRTSVAERTQGMFSVAGPEETSQLRLAQEPFVQPGYAELNPSYDQPTNAKPVWSLAKPLPRVVRPGMVPTKEEALQIRERAQPLTEHSQKLGLDVDPNDLEKGQIRTSADPRKIAAQVKDARLQRENNLMNKILGGETLSARHSSCLSRTSSERLRRSSTWAMPLDRLPTVEEGELQMEHEAQQIEHDPGDDPLSAPDERDPLLGDEIYETLDKPVLDEKSCPEDLHLLVQDLVEDEVHNNHTTWSVIRTHHREALAESLAVFIQLTIGFCADLAVTMANAGNPNTTAWAWGLATMIAIYIGGGVSGAHLNPAITVVLWFYRGFPTRKLPGYFTAQFLGSFCAALVAYGVYYQSIRHYISANVEETSIINSFVTSPQNPWITPTTAFFNEFVGTAILSIVILAIGDDQNSPPGPGMNALIVGLIITCLAVTFSHQTGGALSPSRDFGPRMCLLALGYGRHLFTNSYWFYGPWLGSLSGAFTGAFMYDFMIFTGGESPVNYPVERTKRAMKKSCMKEKGKLHLAREERVLA